ncbi:hypothetical protein OIU78_010297 [Salix suchowensis]|nr:hypothetical protein OIU78_010297 [Salix suchowensis]
MIDTPLSFNPSLPQLNLPSSSTTTTATTTMPSTASQSTSHPPNCLSHSGLSDVPANWKGIRETRPDFPASSCNKKLIGARAFNNGYITHKVLRYGEYEFIKSSRVDCGDSGEELIADSHLLLATEVAPKVAAFSSRGPNYLKPEILKPVAIAPGVNILADLELDPRRVEFNIVSGTTMSCPHVSGIAAMLRKAYPD